MRLLYLYQRFINVTDFNNLRGTYRQSNMPTW